MQRILCFGDSNTWGFNPDFITAGASVRYNFNQRWTKLLAQKLGQDFCILEEGLNGRTIGSFNSDKPYDIALKSLPTILQKHQPLDLIAVMLGTNDTNSEYNKTYKSIASDLAKVIKIIKDYCTKVQTANPKILIITPPKINAKIANKYFSGIDGQAEQKSERLEKEYISLTKAEKCEHLSTLALPMGSDGLHLSLASHAKLAQMLYEKIRQLNLPNDIAK